MRRMVVPKTYRQQEVYNLRRSILMAVQQGRCFYCHGRMRLTGRGSNDPEAFTLDHFIPVSRGGTGRLDNLVGACRRCNNLKADGPPLVFADIEWSERIAGRIVRQSDKLEGRLNCGCH